MSEQQEGEGGGAAIMTRHREHPLPDEDIYVIRYGQDSTSLGPSLLSLLKFTQVGIQAVVSEEACTGSATALIYTTCTSMLQCLTSSPTSCCNYQYPDC